MWYYDTDQILTVNFIKPTCPTYVLQSLQGQPSGANFLILLLNTVREHVSLVSLGILFHILASQNA